MKPRSDVKVLEVTVLPSMADSDAIPLSLETQQLQGETLLVHLVIHVWSVFMRYVRGIN